MDGIIKSANISNPSWDLMARKVSNIAKATKMGIVFLFCIKQKPIYFSEQSK